MSDAVSSLVSTRPADHKTSVRNRALALLIIASVVVCYAGVLASLVRQWSSNDMYAHGFLIPIISGYVIYERRAALAQAGIAPARPVGWVVLAAGLMMLVGGELGGVQLASQLSLLVSLAGTVLVLFGRAWLRILWFPLSFLLFMIPVWEEIVAPLHAPFQRLSAGVGAALLDVVGIPVRRDGLFIQLPNVTLEVARACSGVNFLVAIVAVGIPHAYLRLQTTWRRVAAIVIAAIVALVSNGLRVTLIGFLAYYGLTGPDIHGPGHLLQGMFVAVVGFVALFGTVHLLSRGERRLNPEVEQSLAIASIRTDDRVLRLATVPTTVTIAILLIVAVFIGLHGSTPVEPLRPLSSFPRNLDVWRGGAQTPAPSYFRDAGADQEISRLYYGPGGSVHLYVGYFADQRLAKELITYHTYDLQRQASTVEFDAQGVKVEANEAAESVAGRPHYILYWYDINGRRTASPYLAKLWTIWNSLLRNQTNGAVVMLAAELPAGVDRKRTSRGVQALAQLSAVQLVTYLPR